MTYALPDIPSQLADDRRKVYTALVIGLLVNVIASIDPAKAKAASVTSEIKPAVKQVNLIGWGVLFVILTAGVDWYTTADLTVAFALLIFVAALFIHGPKALANIQTLIDINQPAK